MSHRVCYPLCVHVDETAIIERVRRALRRRLRPAMQGPTAALDVMAWTAPGRVSFDQARGSDYRPFAVGEAWGAPWATTWFQLSGEVPAGWSGETVEAVIDLGWTTDGPGFTCEGLAFDDAGRELKGLSPRNRWIPCAGEPGPVRLWVEAAANPRIDESTAVLGDPRAAGDEPLFRLLTAELAVRRPLVAALVSDVEVLLGLAVELGRGEPRRAEILQALARMLDGLALADDVADGAATARAALADVLARPATASAHRVSAVGNAHIDTAWLWPLDETRRKVARTLANALHLIEADPGYTFCFSQAQQLQWLADDRPALWERVRAAVAAGRIVPIGGLWVEPDGNLPGGEAMARQLIYGKRFFMRELGIETEEVWLPDSFGYSAALPQLAALAGNRFMVTQKLSWNDTNRFPHHTFWWEGIDGTRLFTHFPPVDTYTAEMTPAELLHASRTFAESGRATRSLVPFGHGDGGGGPTREMLAAIDREADLEGLPRVTVETPARFFEQALAEYPDAPVWSGELYLELHRGTFTTQADVKAANRRCEHLLHEAELWAASAAVRAGAVYPRAELERLYKQLCLLQFHDILPGSSIAWVYDDAAAMYAELERDAEAIVTTSLQHLAGPGDETVVVNATPHTWDGVPALGAAVRDSDGDGNTNASLTRGRDGELVLANGLVAATIDARGLVTSLRRLPDGREAIAPGGAGNLLVLHPDTPNRWEAWDVDASYRDAHLDLTEADAIEVVDDGPGLVAVRVHRHHHESTIVQRLSLAAGETRLAVETEVDWHEHERLLKAAWPLDVHASVATSEIQFGHLQRPTHANTSWDAARFEVWAHRFVHVGETGFGVAITTTAGYGHDVSRAARPGGGTTTTLRLSLLRGPRYPDPRADQGRHRFRWHVHPGASVADAVREGYRTNLPLRTVSGARAHEPLVRLSGDAAVVIETVKLADDDAGDVIVRLYESLGGRARARIVPGFAVGAVGVVDLLERPLGDPLVLDDGAVSISLRPFEILTLRFARP